MIYHILQWFILRSFHVEKKIEKKKNVFYYCEILPSVLCYRCVTVFYVVLSIPIICLHAPLKLLLITLYLFNTKCLI